MTTNKRFYAFQATQTFVAKVETTKRTGSKEHYFPSSLQYAQDIMREDPLFSLKGRSFVFSTLNNVEMKTGHTLFEYEMKFLVYAGISFNEILVHEEPMGILERKVNVMQDPQLSIRNMDNETWNLGDLLIWRFPDAKSKDKNERVIAYFTKYKPDLKDNDWPMTDLTKSKVKYAPEVIKEELRRRVCGKVLEKIERNKIGSVQLFIPH